MCTGLVENYGSRVNVDACMVNGNVYTYMQSTIHHTEILDRAVLIPHACLVIFLLTKMPRLDFKFAITNVINHL